MNFKIIFFYVPLKHYIISITLKVICFTTSTLDLAVGKVTSHICSNFQNIVLFPIEII